MTPRWLEALFYKFQESMQGASGIETKYVKKRNKVLTWRKNSLATWLYHLKTFMEQRTIQGVRSY